MTAPKKRNRSEANDSTLPFEVTQEIEPALADLLRRSSEPTLTQEDFDEIAIEPPHTRNKRK